MKESLRKVEGVGLRAIAGVLALGVFLASGAPGEPYPQDLPRGECKTHWRSLGFSAGAEDPSLSTSFDPQGEESYPQFYRRLERDRCWKEWLVLVYMAADNALAPYSYRDLWEMQAVGSYPSVDVVAFHGDERRPGGRYLHLTKVHDQEDYRHQLESFVEKQGLSELEEQAQEIAYLEKEGPSLVVSPVVKSVPRDSARDGRALGAFVDWAVRHYPSRRLVFIGWGHGEGFGASSKEVLPVTEMVPALRKVLEERRGGKAIDIAGSDACLNQQVEFGYEWREVADYVFGSSTIVQRKGFNYRTLLKNLAERPLWETHDLAREIPRLYGGSVGAGAGKKYSSYYDPYATMAVWATAELRFLRLALDELAAELLAWIRSPQEEIERLARAVEIRDLLGKSLRLGGVSNDLHNVLQVLEGWARDLQNPTADSQRGILDRLRRGINETQDALGRSVLARHVGPKYVSSLVLTSKAVAVWLPQSEIEWKDLAPRFEKSRFWRDPKRPGGLSPWAQFIREVYGP